MQNLPDLRKAREKYSSRIAEGVPIETGRPKMLHFCVYQKPVKPEQEDTDKEKKDNRVLVIGATREMWNLPRKEIDKDGWAISKREVRCTKEEMDKHGKSREKLREDIFKVEVGSPGADKKLSDCISEHRKHYTSSRWHNGPAMAMEFPGLRARDRCILCFGTTAFEMYKEGPSAGTCETLRYWPGPRACAEFITCIIGERLYS